MGRVFSHRSDKTLPIQLVGGRDAAASQGSAARCRGIASWSAAVVAADHAPVAGDEAGGLEAGGVVGAADGLAVDLGDLEAAEPAPVDEPGEGRGPVGVVVAGEGEDRAAAALEVGDGLAVGEDEERPGRPGGPAGG